MPSIAEVLETRDYKIVMLTGAAHTEQQNWSPALGNGVPLLSNNMKVRLVRRKVPINCTVTYYKEVLKEVKQQILVCVD